MSLRNIRNHPLLQTSKLVKVIQEFDFAAAASEFRLAAEMPIRPIEQSRIRYDIRKGAGGMTQAAVKGAESPIVAFFGAAMAEFEPAEWREKVILTEDEMLALRELGTYEDVEKVSTIIAKHLAALRTRLETRMEWTRWQALLGSMSYVAKDVELSVDYHIPTELKPTLTGADLWTASASTPMDDFLEWLEKFRDLLAQPQGAMFNHKMFRVLLQNAQVRALRDSLFVGQTNTGMLTPENLKLVFNHFAGIGYDVYDGGYFEYTDLTAAVASSGTSLVVRDLGTIAAGDSLWLTDVAGSVAGRTKLTVTAVTASTKTITVASPGADRTYAAGSTVRVKKYFIPDGKFIIKGALPASTEGGAQWAEIIAASHLYGPNPLQPATGIFAKTVVHEDADPPKIELIVGARALPVVYHSDVNLIATAF